MPTAPFTSSGRIWQTPSRSSTPSSRSPGAVPLYGCVLNCTQAGTTRSGYRYGYRYGYQYGYSSHYSHYSHYSSDAGDQR